MSTNSTAKIKEKKNRQKASELGHLVNIAQLRNTKAGGLDSPDPLLTPHSLLDDTKIIEQKP